MTAVKICGMRCAKDLEVCRKADYLGFVVNARSPRELDLGTAYDLMSVCDNLRVAVTTETDLGRLESLVRHLDPDVLQLHVPLDRELLESTSELGVPIWGMATVTPGLLVDCGCMEFCQALVLDSPGERTGGNGTVHDWEMSRKVRDDLQPFPVVLAGGLRADNVEEAIAKVDPFAVDVSSGVEGSCGKDLEKVKGLLDAIKRVDRT